MTGFQDLLPAQAWRRQRLERALSDEIQSWGYRPVVTPLVEDAELLGRTLGPAVEAGLLKLIDAGGQVLALVAERTVPVARVAAGQLRGESVPLRLCYSAPVVWREPRPGGGRQGHQLGAELIGVSGAAADAEPVALAARVLEAAGLRSFQLDVGHAGFFRGLLEGISADQELQSRLTAALSGRDFVELDRALEQTELRGAEHELLLRFPTLRGGPEILEAAAPLVRSRIAERALEELRAVHEVLQHHGLSEVVNLDLGAIRDFRYYTGVIFEAFSLELGSPLAAGGRYDDLMTAVGLTGPATGFVIHLERVEEALRREAAPGIQRRGLALVGYGEGGHAAALRLAESLRRAGVRAEVEVAPAPAAGVPARPPPPAAACAFHCSDASLRGAPRGAERMLPLAPGAAVALALASPAA